MIESIVQILIKNISNNFIVIKKSFNYNHSLDHDNIVFIWYCFTKKFANRCCCLSDTSACIYIDSKMEESDCLSIVKYYVQ